MPLGFVSAQSRLYDNEFDLGDVQLLDSPFKHALDLNTEVLLQYDVDRLLAPYLKAAGLEPKGESFPTGMVSTVMSADITFRLWRYIMPLPVTRR